MPTAQIDQLFDAMDPDKSGGINMGEIAPRLRRDCAPRSRRDCVAEIAAASAEPDKGAANLLQGLDIDESLGLEQVDEQIRDYLSKRAVRVIELFRQWDDDGTGKRYKLQATSYKLQATSCKLQVASCKLDCLQASSLRRAARSLQLAACSLQPAACSLQLAALQLAACSLWLVTPQSSRSHPSSQSWWARTR